jgi:glutamate carboxypeptidase
MRLIAAFVASAALALSGAFQSLAAQHLAPVEARIAEAVSANRATAVELLAETVDINSGTLNVEGQRRVYDALAPHFEALGFEVRYAGPDVSQRGGHLVATRTGDRGKRLLLIGHLDTVFEEDSPFQRWERLDEQHGARAGGLGHEGRQRRHAPAVARAAP